MCWAERRIDRMVLTDPWAEDTRIPVVSELQMPAILVGRHRSDTRLPAVWTDDAAAAVGWTVAVLVTPPIPPNVTPAVILIALGMGAAAVTAGLRANPRAALAAAVCAGTVAALLILNVVGALSTFGPPSLIPDLAPGRADPGRRPGAEPDRDRGPLPVGAAVWLADRCRARRGIPGHPPTRARRRRPACLPHADTGRHRVSEYSRQDTAALIPTGVPCGPRHRYAQSTRPVRGRLRATSPGSPDDVSAHGCSGCRTSQSSSTPTSGA
jgi:hypothetical protein